ncbi:hypothetical protein Tco_1121033 [Tanacetum coccineum]|uniref:Reverse transcriptase domain-containing protein n=1 Tax=Tanacetum coccineum TaxID=301880 RepID=A0ABQ5IZ57_9ASTR
MEQNHIIRNWSILPYHFRVPPYSFNYPTRRLTMEEILAKFIDKGKHEHEEMEIFIKEFRTSNELLLKERNNLLSELKIEMTSEATPSKEINETGINKNEPPRFEHDVQEKPHDVGVKNKSSTLVQIPKYAKYLKSLLTNKSKLEEACNVTMNERCSAILLNKLPSKEKDPGSFTIPCQVLEKCKGAKDLAAYHLSRLEDPHTEMLSEREIADEFPDKHLMLLKSKLNDDEPWYADFVNYIVGKVVSPNWTFEKRKRFFSQVKTYFWEEPYAFKLCADNIIRRCVAGSETLEILAHCHSGPTGGHHSASVTTMKFTNPDFISLVFFKDANEYIR